MDTFFKIFLTILILVLCASNIISKEITIVDLTDLKKPIRLEKKNLINLELGNELLIAGVSYYRMLNPFHAIGFGIGTWSHNSSYGILYKFFPLKSNWSPYTGTSLVAYWISSDKDNAGRQNEMRIDALGIYFPLGIQYIGNSGFIFSFELGTYFSSILKLTVEKNLILENTETEQSLSKLYFSKTSDFQLWGGFKIGYAF